jgi:hypothetical protein
LNKSYVAASYPQSWRHVGIESIQYVLCSNLLTGSFGLSCETIRLHHPFSNPILCYRAGTLTCTYAHLKIVNPTGRVDTCVDRGAASGDAVLDADHHCARCSQRSVGAGSSVCAECVRDRFSSLCSRFSALHNHLSP